MKNFQMLATATLLGLTGCATEMAVVRTDGQSVAGNPVLAENYRVDQAVCNGETQKANLSGMGGYNGGLALAIERQNAAGQVMNGCLAQKGYVVVEKDKADAKLAHYQELARLKSQQQVATGSIAPAQGSR